MSKMSQIQTTLKPKDVEAVKNRVEALMATKLSNIHHNQLIQNKGFREPERDGDREIDEGKAANQCIFIYFKYWLKLEAKLKDAPLCSKDGIEYMKRMQKRAEYAGQWIAQTKKEQLEAFYGRNF